MLRRITERLCGLQKKKREKSDYDALAMITEEEAESIVEDAARFLERIKRAIEELK
jgi:uncharacterized protein (UPF0332 family)